ncbi:MULTISPECIES: cytochrome c oxidase subunit II [unclassified Sporosarcina]|uniref:cytochrome c oxidase subunit II n=1 Tax=unclassified Sporosarcina TaxID=2647733 RepID=UPI000C162ADC|nr:MULTISPECIES: cytochrome c oxidase subunit II [unclassified Sporosarcina]PIC86281.1 cytochrome B5 [Sporosarcina sp. P20a]PIC97829.1 cytochrome B5 [Sporosarcina sp. P29]PID03171.1 cytochrome B5 [Sporosarcina sp. P30]PID07424.1 cytochrome B5 [Sporosarcina sp. P31]PID10617.1 cytochrome B5 [Sporosarcina sp. P32b]
MHLHKYEKVWLVFGLASLVLFLLIIGFAAFWKGTHPQSHIETIDPQNVEANESFQPENLGLTEVADGKYVVNIVASAFNYDFGKEEDGTATKTIRVPKGSTVLFQVTSKDVVHGFQVAGTNVNMMVEPGHISRFESVMKNGGEFTVVCNEYCGIGHHLMFGTVEVY